MARRRKRLNDNENLDRWLLTYADLITLLLAFFVVMYSMSVIDAKKFGAMQEALRGKLKGGPSLLKHPDPKADKGHGILKLGNLKIIQQKIENRFKGLNKVRGVETEITERGLVIHIMESLLFKSGSAELQSSAIDVLDQIADAVRFIPNHIRVEGHTDDQTITTSLFQSNWELSTARATAVVRYYMDGLGIGAHRLSALGYGAYRPIRVNNSIENRAANRRVDVVILTMELTMTEPTSQLYDLAQNP